MKFEKLIKLLVPSAEIIHATQMLFIITSFVGIASLFIRSDLVSLLTYFKINPDDLLILPLQSVCNIAAWFGIYLITVACLAAKLDNLKITYALIDLLSEFNLVMAIILIGIFSFYGPALFATGTERFFFLCAIGVSLITFLPRN